MSKIFLILLLFFSTIFQISASDLVGEYFWVSYKKASNEYSERLEEMKKEENPDIIYKINNVYVLLNSIDCFDPSCPPESDVIKAVADARGNQLLFKELLSENDFWDCDNGDYFIKHCSSKVADVNFDLYLNPVEEKDILQLRKYKNEFSIIQTLRTKDVIPQLDEIPMKKVVNKISLYDPKTLKVSYVIDKGSILVVRTKRKINKKYFMAGKSGIFGLLQIEDFKKHLK